MVRDAICTRRCGGGACCSEDAGYMGDGNVLYLDRVVVTWVTSFVKTQLYTVYFIVGKLCLG